jgi:uncharacterized delta-60 repeat protein
VPSIACKFALLAACLSGALLVPTAANAAGAASDLSFGAAGVSRISVSDGHDIASDFVVTHGGVQPLDNGKLLVAAEPFGTSGTSYYSVTRLDTGGARDPSFGGDGTIKILIGRHASVRSIAVDAAGRILLAGDFAYSTGRRVAVVRLLHDGTLDPTFSGDGKAFLDYSLRYDFANRVVAAPTGHVVVAGGTYDGSKGRAVVSRLTAIGTPDIAFNTTGSLHFTAYGRWSAIIDATLTPTGEVLLAGGASSPDYWTIRHDAFVARVTVLGRLDAAWGYRGLAHVSSGMATSVVHSPQDERVYMAGTQDGRTVFVGALTESGQTDYTFQPWTRRVFSRDRGLLHVDIAQQADGALVGATSTDTFGEEDMALFRLRNSGAPDTCFDRAGTTVIDTSSRIYDYDRAYYVASQADGRILALGDAYPSSAYLDLVLARVQGAVLGTPACEQPLMSFHQYAASGALPCGSDRTHPCSKRWLGGATVGGRVATLAPLLPERRTVTYRFYKAAGSGWKLSAVRRSTADLMGEHRIALGRRSLGTGSWKITAYVAPSETSVSALSAPLYLRVR